MELLNPNKINLKFSKYHKPMLILSAITTIIALVLLFAPGINYGIDFKGGIEAHLRFSDKTDIATLRTTLDPALTNVSVVGFSDAANEFLITAQEDDKASITQALTGALTGHYGAASAETWQVLTMDVVGAKVGEGLLKSAILAIVYTCLLITVFMYWRFDLRFAPGALFCIFHDLVIVGGFLALTGIEFSTTVVAALLTLAGYSINDTVVVYDRIRETESKYLGKTKVQIVDYAVNSTLSRTIMTTATTLVSCAVLYFLGGIALRDFAATLFVGIIVGTYSSIYVAAPVYVWASEKFKIQEGTVATTR